MPMVFGSRSDDSGREGRGSQRRKEKKTAGRRAQRNAFERVVELCTIRDRSASELRERLQKDGYGADEVDLALSRAISCGLVDDMRFADAFIRGKVSAGKGAAGIERDLAKHDISVSQLGDWPEGYGLDEQSQIERAVSLLRSHPPKSKDTWAAAFRKVVGRGYSQSVASSAARIWSETPECDA